MGRRIVANSLRLTAAFAAAAFVFSMAPAHAADGDSGFYKATVGRFLESLGLKSSDDDATIDYRERPPLVIPPGNSLPPPEKQDTISNPAWPKDPDVTRAKLEAKREKERPDSETERLKWEDPKQMNEQALTPGPRPRGVQANSPGSARSGATDTVLSPSALGYKGGMWGKMFHSDDDNVATFTAEPPRASLTDPPQGYQTPSPNQPYGLGKAPPPKPDDYYSTHAEPTR